MRTNRNNTTLGKSYPFIKATSFNSGRVIYIIIMNSFIKKYKQRYPIYYSHFEQKGGALITIDKIDYFNIFDRTSEEYIYINPLWGFLLNTSGYIKNYYNFGVNKKKQSYIKNIFYKLNENEIKITNNIMNLDSLLILNDIGKFLGYQFYKEKIYNEHLEKKNKIFNSYKKLLLKNGLDINTIIFDDYINNKNNIQTIVNNKIKSLSSKKQKILGGINPSDI